MTDLNQKKKKLRAKAAAITGLLAELPDVGVQGRVAAIRAQCAEHGVSTLHELTTAQIRAMRRRWLGMGARERELYLRYLIEDLAAQPAPRFYRAVVLDPPWNERGGGGRGADCHYPVLTTDRIVALLRDEWALHKRLAPDAVVFCWVTNNHLFDGRPVLEALGAEYKTMITWSKDSIGLGYYFRGQTEHVLFGVRGKIGRPDPADWSSTQLGGGILERPGGHSHKPDELLEMIERRFEGPHLEVFARRSRPGWDALGNEIDGGTQ